MWIIFSIEYLEMNKTKRKDLIYDGKAKKIFSCQDDNLVIQYFKDDTTANNAQKHSIISGKGVINNRISEYLMQSIEKIGIPTHFLERLNMREQLVKKVEIIPIEFVVRNISAGSISKKFNIPEGKVFKQPIIEYYLKNDDLGDPMMCESHLIRLGYIKSDELDEIIDFSVSSLPKTMIEFIELGDDGLSQANAVIAQAENRISVNDVKLMAPIQRPNKILGVGLNYKAHKEEAAKAAAALLGKPQEKYPTIFNKQNSSVVGPYDDMHKPNASDFFDYEGELGFVMGKRCRHVPVSYTHLTLPTKA